MNQETRPLGILQHEELVARSKRRIIAASGSSSTVIKYFKEGEKSRGDSLLENAKKRIAADNRLREIVINMGSSPEIVPETHRVICHSQEDADVVEVQEWYQDAKHLQDLGLRTLYLNIHALKDIRSLLIANKKLWKESQTTLDLAGTLEADQTPTFKLLQQLFPIFLSLNILIDSSENVRYIDTDRFIKDQKRTFKIYILQNVQVLGSTISEKIIDVAIFFKKLRAPNNRTINSIR